jgi:hypothetical protein
LQLSLAGFSPGPEFDGTAELSVATVHRRDHQQGDRRLFPDRQYAGVEEGILAAGILSHDLSLLAEEHYAMFASRGGPMKTFAANACRSTATLSHPMARMSVFS